MKLWVDDIRPAPDETWTVAHNYDAAIFWLAQRGIKLVSLDHDLGEDRTGYDIVCAIERWMIEGDYKPPAIDVHSANPVGRRNIMAAVRSIEGRSAWSI